MNDPLERHPLSSPVRAQAFQTKGAKKKAKGSMAAVTTKTGSIFASPEGLGGKVGVTGSGQGLTEQAPRKKFRTKLEK